MRVNLRKGNGRRVVADEEIDEIDEVKDVDIDDRAMLRIEAIITSMTKKERAKPDIINGSRRKRIAAGAGVKVEDVNRLMAQYVQMKKMFKQMNSKGGKRKFARGGFPGMPPGGFPGM